MDVAEYQALQRQRLLDSFHNHDVIEKGMYVNNPENRSLHRVGIHYGGKKPTREALGNVSDRNFQSLLADAKGMRDKHRQQFPKTIKEMRSMFKGDEVTGRVKFVKSAIEKIIRKPKYKTPKNLQDFSGFRIVSKDIPDVLRNVEAFKKEYHVIEEDNYIDQPLGDYRSYHLIGEKDGVQFEVQFRTKNENTYGDWAHEIYKPLTQESIETLRKYEDIVNAYSHKISTYFWLLDTGQKASKPPCIYIIKITFGCL